jgi:leucyl-tRNA synthetase
VLANLVILLLKPPILRYHTITMSFDHKSIDKKWQEIWERNKIFNAKDDDDREKYYCLIEFPYPSGAGLHMGHPRSYTALDIIARKKRMEGFNVLYPIGWDAFGLPTENFAIKNHRKPQDVTKENTDTFRRQLKSLGFSFDWSREINTTDPNYYKWTQWMFIKFFEAGLAYKAKTKINWCLSCKIGLANEEVVGGVCERCGGEVEKRDKEQWMIAITKYADRLLSDLDTVDYLPKIKKQQQDWIGKSDGAEVDFQIVDFIYPEANAEGSHGADASIGEGVIRVFTTRPDTLFGATYMVLAPEHPLVNQITTSDRRAAVEAYVAVAGKKPDIDRADATKEKTGEFTGAYVINPVNGERIPVWVADYVMMGYGTGAIMAVPAHDDRDYAFAKKFKLPIVKVVESDEATEDYFVGDGKAINSDFLDGLSTDEAKKRITSWLEEKGLGKAAVNYKLRDWVFSRQRYWGEPIPLVNCEACGWVPVPNDQLPVILPEVEKYEPTDTGESPLSAINDWVNTSCPKCGKSAKRETDTMPNWAGSSWYFLRYLDPNNQTAFADKKKIDYWMPVDLYNGGMEHTTLHLLYSRFWHKFLFDQGLVSTPEPYARRHSHGLILASDGRKMSKSLGNVINPDDIIDQYGADALRVYEMFMGPFEEPVPWSTNGLIGVRRFLDKVVRLKDAVRISEEDVITKALHKTIKKVTEDIDALRFNTAVSQMMIFVNEVQNRGSISKDSFLKFLQILCPFAPHLSNELASELGVADMLETFNWPKYDSDLVVDSLVTITVQVNGKLRAEIKAAPDAEQEEVEALARENENIAKYISSGVKKVIYVQGRLINFVV